MRQPYISLVYLEIPILHLESCLQMFVCLLGEIHKSVGIYDGEIIFKEGKVPTFLTEYKMSVSEETSKTIIPLCI